MLGGWLRRSYWRWRGRLRARRFLRTAQLGQQKESGSKNAARRKTPARNFAHDIPPLRLVRCAKAGTGCLSISPYPPDKELKLNSLTSISQLGSVLDHTGSDQWVHHQCDGEKHDARDYYAADFQTTHSSCPNCQNRPRWLRKLAILDQVAMGKISL